MLNKSEVDELRVKLTELKRKHSECFKEKEYIEQAIKPHWNYYYGWYKSDGREMTEHEKQRHEKLTNDINEYERQMAEVQFIIWQNTVSFGDRVIRRQNGELLDNFIMPPDKGTGLSPLADALFGKTEGESYSYSLDPTDKEDKKFRVPAQYKKSFSGKIIKIYKTKERMGDFISPFPQRKP